jgi:hypothetical protein
MTTEARQALHQALVAARYVWTYGFQFYQDHSVYQFNYAGPDRTIMYIRYLPLKQRAELPGWVMSHHRYNGPALGTTVYSTQKQAYAAAVALLDWWRFEPHLLGHKCPDRLWIQPTLARPTRNKMRQS